MTKAVTSSVEEAITEAGGDPKTFTEAAHVTETKLPDADVTADVVVIGSGASCQLSPLPRRAVRWLFWKKLVI
ncbi:hypothetical protein G8B25_06700 [Lactobacillus delbrueckii]|uniref:hypothetical protein n=1 Tax=Lactobacillus delbrueckii TaxID=1584 RepID=UPI001E4C105C|nr:hypothetical protein [Lactobacillus delbrueckii]MCD5576694.1 hypothetical protein [Lactobacillus delbrueckii subsp. lactis]UNL38968.1 hypothetical protein G8B25_06700 [Lactobacillus delbrueckii]